MSLDIGTLVGYLDLDDSKLRRKLRDESRFKPLGAALAKETKRMESDSERSGAEVGRKIVKSVAGELEKGSGKQRAAVARMMKGAEGEAGQSGERAGRSFTDGFRQHLGKLKGDDAGMSDAAKGILGSLKGTLAAGMAPTAGFLATAFSAQFTGAVVAGLASGAVKLAHGFGASLALLPAVAVAAGLALGTVKVALSGVGDALKAGLSGDTEAFNEALKGMAPEARRFARNFVTLRGELKDLKREVQGRFFAPLIDDIKPLGERYLPILQSAMGGIAAQMGRTGSNIGSFLRTPSTAVKLAFALNNGSTAVQGFVAGLSNLVRAFVPVLAIGSGFLPAMTDGFAGATAELARMAREGERTGKIKDFIQGGIDKLKELWGTGEQVWRIVKNVVAVFQLFGGFGGIFSALGLKSGGLIDKLEELTTKAREFFGTSAGGKAMAEAIRIVRNLMNASVGMFQKLAVILAPFLPQIARLATAVQNLMTAVVDSVEPAVQVIGGSLLPALSSVLEWLSRNQPVLQGILIGLFTAWAIHAGVAAAATIAATWPLILLGVAVAALAALVIIHFDTIVSVIKGAWNWVKENWPLLLTMLTGPFGLAFVIITGNLDRLWANIKALPGKIRDVAAGMWNAILDNLYPVVARVAEEINRMISAYNRLPGPNISMVTVPGQTRAIAPAGGSGQTSHRGGGGGSLRMHSGGHVPGGAHIESWKLLQGGEEVLARNDPRNTRNHPTNIAARVSGDSSPKPVNVKVTLHGDGTGQGLLEFIRYSVAVQGGGDVQYALGR